MASRAKILVIDDEPQIHRFLQPALEANGFEAARAETGLAGIAEVGQVRPDAIVLDLGLPDLDGQEVLTRIRKVFEGPILILSARDQDDEKVQALDNGADDYVEKPFSVPELLARLRAAMRNKLGLQGAHPIVKAGELEVDLVRRTVTRAGLSVKLSPKEYDILAELAKGAGRVLTPKHLLTKVWGPANSDDIQYLRNYVAQLRQKLEPDPARPRHIVTEPGVGYRFLEAD